MARRAFRLAVVAGFGVIAVMATPSAVAGQVRTLDEGTFTVFVAGERVGREDFSIRAIPGSGANAYLAQANILRGETRLSVALSTDTAGYPARFSMERILDGRVVETITGEARRGIWLGRALRAGGESAREFRIPATTVVADLGVLHQLWFVIRRGTAAPQTLLLPSLLQIGDLTLEDAGPDNVTLGVREIVTRHWVVRAAGSDVPVREAWTDLQGRVLRIRIPAMDLEALRDEPPSETAGAGAP